MYSPVSDGIEKTAQSVRYTEAMPPNDLAEWVHCFWELKTVSALQEDFQLHALPDACVNILLNQHDTEIAGITALRTTYEVLNLGKWFHYVGVQLLPGVWKGDPAEISDSFVGNPYLGPLPLISTNKALSGLAFADMHSGLADLIRWLVDKKIVVANTVTAAILANLDDIRSVADMAAASGLSPRQLQRVLSRTTGFAPHDLLKILRLQQSIRQDYLMSYTDQAHFIHSFKRITGYTPARYFSKFRV
ncbi:MAG: AraC family transcriptional regulator [Natronospirillum sp.]|uniref:helix-turn-helix domain-containing protein n=1 Tax=Natronospirillum sp. TaxID=2812955 RepID=UPI0025F42C78|nr:AraC family transcriptional regulator [Natronospirillum sp.]MCH8552293.1 AraC family transcriptional regulator [Natronospirillum sp.]